MGKVRFRERMFGSAYLDPLIKMCKITGMWNIWAAESRHHIVSHTVFLGCVKSAMLSLNVGRADH